MRSVSWHMAILGVVVLAALVMLGFEPGARRVGVAGHYCAHAGGVPGFPAPVPGVSRSFGRVLRRWPGIAAGPRAMDRRPG